MPRKFAQGTKITVAQTIADVQSQLARFGGTRFQTMIDPVRSLRIFLFEMYDDKLRQHIQISYQFEIPVAQREILRKHRTAFLAIKGKLASIADGIESPAQAFYAFVVHSSGQTMFEKTRAMLIPASGDKR